MKLTFIKKIIDSLEAGHESQEEISVRPYFINLHNGIAFVLFFVLFLSSPAINDWHRQHYGSLARGEQEVSALTAPLSAPELPVIIEDYLEQLRTGVPSIYDDVIIRIPRLEVETNVVPPPITYSVSAYNTLLQQGPVFLTDSVPPGGEGNVSITAHRVGHGYYFRDLDFLEEGDEIILDTPEFIIVYKFVYNKIVNEYDWSLIRDHSEVRRIVLHTCDPKTTYSHTPDRLIVRGELDRIESKTE